MSSTEQCQICRVQLVASDSVIKCSDCSSKYHTGKCAGVSDTTIKSKGEPYRNAWRCAVCRRSKSRPQPPEKPSFDPDTQDIRTWLKSIHEKLEYLMPLKETVESIEDSVQFMSERYDELLTRTERNEQEVRDLKRRLEKVEAQDDELVQMRREVDDLEWRSRRLNLEFHGIQTAENEDLVSEINKLAAKIKLPLLDKNDIVAIHRLPSKKDKIPGVICRFAKQTDRDMWWQNRKKLSDAHEDLFLLENLTKRTRTLLFETKVWAKANNFKYVWHHNNKVLMRKVGGDPVVVVTNACDRDRLR
ncbi:uncharacterized protein LOC144179549 [Haemaphysalis longicornis]